jgi:hypothetical protein
MATRKDFWTLELIGRPHRRYRHHSESSPQPGEACQQSKEPSFGLGDHPDFDKRIWRRFVILLLWRAAINAVNRVWCEAR